MSPFLRDRIGELKSWDDVKLLTVAIDRLRQWYRPGLLCIGDAAHAMSPIGGVGINLAIQDAVAAANLLAAPLKAGQVTEADLAAVQRRRTLPMKVIQWVQVQIQERVLTPVLASTQTPAVPWPVKMLNRFPMLRRLPARLVGMGIRPEHVMTESYAQQLTAFIPAGGGAMIDESGPWRASSGRACEQNLWVDALWPIPR